MDEFYYDLGKSLSLISLLFSHQEASGPPVTGEVSKHIKKIAYPAIEKLAPLVGLEDIPVIEYGLDSLGCYYKDAGIIAIAPADINRRLKHVIGHETGHLLHNQVNPGVFPSHRRFGSNPDYFRDNVTEMVAELFAYALMDSNFRVREHDVANLTRYVGRLDLATRKLLREKLQGDEAVRNYERHIGGYLAAKYIYDNFGTAPLNDLARSPLDDAARLVRFLGYEEPLFLPHMEDDYVSVYYMRGRQVLSRGPVTVSRLEDVEVIDLEEKAAELGLLEEKEAPKE